MQNSAGLKIPAALLALVVLAACSSSTQPGTPPQPTPAGQRLGCVSGDHGLFEAQLGWGFCYPGNWRFRERVQTSTFPVGVDTTFDIVDGSTRQPTSGQFGFLIIGTYQIGTATNLQEWLKANGLPDAQVETIRWGNSREAVKVTNTSLRYAMTSHHVVMLDPRQGSDNLDLEGELVKRLSTWQFDY